MCILYIYIQGVRQCFTILVFTFFQPDFLLERHTRVFREKFNFYFHNLIAEKNKTKCSK